MSDLSGLSVGQLVAGLGDGDFTPTDIARACIQRVAALEPSCLAWQFFDADALERQASAATQRLCAGHAIRPLESIPVGVKDIFNTADFPTQMGSPLWKDFTPGNDARIVFTARQLGALIPGKTTTAEFAVHALSKTLNPHAPAHTPGTSSSGSAVAVLARMTPIALGTQTAGSIIRPASFCGVYGFKPSFGLLPRTGMLKTTDSLDTIGFFAAHRSDLRPVLETLRVKGSNYPIVQKRFLAPASKTPGQPWRIAFLRTHTWSQAEEDIRAKIEQWLAQVANEPDMEVTEVAEPVGLADAHAVHARIYDKALAYYFREEFKRNELISPVMYELIEHGQGIKQADYLNALRQQATMAADMDTLLTGYDAFVSLATSSTAPLREERETPDPALMWTMTYLPALAVPLFRSPSGLPFSLQIGSRRYQDHLLLDWLDTLANRGLVPAESLRIDPASAHFPEAIAP